MRSRRAEGVIDDAALRRLWDEHAGALLAFALQLTGGDRCAAEDVVQETLLRAWRTPDALGVDAALDTWHRQRGSCGPRCAAGHGEVARVLRPACARGGTRRAGCVVTRCPEQGDVGAYVLGVLEPDERERLQRHLATCSACAADLDELAGLPTHLAALPAADVLGAPRAVTPSPQALHRLRAGAAGAVRRRRRARAAAVLAAVAAAGAVAAGALALRSTDRPPEPDVVAAARGPVWARAALTPTDNGTRIVLSLKGVAAHEQCRLVAVGRSGQRQTASTFTATDAGRASVTGWLSLSPPEIDRLLVETLDGAPLLTLPPPDR